MSPNTNITIATIIAEGEGERDSGDKHKIKGNEFKENPSILEIVNNTQKGGRRERMMMRAVVMIVAMICKSLMATVPIL